MELNGMDEHTVVLLEVETSSSAAALRESIRDLLIGPDPEKRERASRIARERLERQSLPRIEIGTLQEHFDKDREDV